MDGWVLWAVGGGVVVIVLVGVDRAFAAGWFDGALERARQRRLERPRTGGGGADAIGMAIDVFQPSHKHLTDEKERERSTTVEVPGGAPPFLDLEAGVATVDGPLPGRSARAPRDDPADDLTDDPADDRADDAR